MDSKNKLMRLAFLVVLLGFRSYVPVVAVQDAYQQGVNFYLDGNIEQAMTSLNEAYEESPENERVKGLLAEVLILKAGELNEREEYEKALDHIGKAKDLRPDDDKVNRVYNMLHSKVHPDEYLKEKEIETTDPEFEEEPEHRDLQEIKEEEEEKREERVRIIEKPPQKLTVRERELLRPIIMTGEDKTDSTIYYVMGGTVFSLMLFMSMAGFWIKNLTQSNRESMEQITQASSEKVERMEKELKKVRREKQRINKKEKKDSHRQKKDRKVREERLKKEYAQLLKEAIQSDNAPRVIEEPRIAESPADKEEEKEVKNSFKRLRKTKYNEAFKLLKSMTGKGNSWVRLWAAELTPDLKVQDRLNILKELVTDPEYQVKKRALKELKNITDSKEVDKVYRIEANNILKEVKTDGWVV